MDSCNIDYEVFKRKILKKTGLDLNAYKQTQMERRLRGLMEQVGAKSFLEYFRILECDEKIFKQFLDKVTINVTEMFRNPEQFEVIQKIVIPEILKRTRSLAVWSAGCSYGHEPYSLAILLKELSPMGKHRIIATDIDEKALNQASAGIYSMSDLKNVSATRIERWFVRDGDKLAVKPALRGMIEFGYLDLLKDPYPNGMDLIVCRNVVIYFIDEAKKRLYEKMFSALKPGGYLFIGSTERVNDHEKIGFLNPYPFIYQKPQSVKEK